MITQALLRPGSIAVVGASQDITKPGGKVLYNIRDHGYTGNLYPVNPGSDTVQGLPAYRSVKDLPQTDLAILALGAHMIEEAMTVLAEEKGTKAFIIFSAGFGEIGEAGKELEQRCVAIADKAGATLIGPNCIGVITEFYKGVFAGPIPRYDAKGCDFVSASGATMVFIVEEAIQRGLKFSSLFSIGNSAQTGVEDILEYWDETFDPKHSSLIKLIYIEQVNDPARFLKHARSLVRKGCRIAAIKAGSTEEGSAAVSSHTGSLAGSNTAVSALFRKAGIVRCYSRVELVYVAAIFASKPLKGNRIAVITHAGGPGVMLTDVLAKGGLQIPRIEGAKAEALMSRLNPGSSVSNPIDFLATGNAEQLGYILDFVDNECDDIDAAVVLFGTTGMWPVNNVYQVLHEKINSLNKPIFPILPSVIQAADEVSHFHSKGHVNFNDEVSFGYVLSRVQKTSEPFDDPAHTATDTQRIRSIIERAVPGYLSPTDATDLLEAAGIHCASQRTVKHEDACRDAAKFLGYPLVMKVVGPVHKSDVGGVQLNIRSEEEAVLVFHELMQISEASAVLMQQQKRGVEVFIGAKREGDFGHVILCGLGGIFVEIFRDVASALTPVGKAEALAMLRHLESYPVIRGARGKEGIDEDLLAMQIVHVSNLLTAAPEIEEMDINPLMGNRSEVVAVDVRIRVQGLKE